MFEERARPRRKLPVRTLVLMVIALIAFIRMWWVMIERPARNAADPDVVGVSPLPPEVAAGDGGR